jgi:hypothetical protein
MEAIDLIKEGINTNNSKLYDKGLLMLDNLLQDMWYTEANEYILNLDFSDYERIFFYMNTTTKMDMLLLGTRLQFTDILFDTYIAENKYYFYNLLKTNIKLQKSFGNWFKKCGDLYEGKLDFYADVFNLIEFQNVVFNDYDEIEKRFSRDSYFFKLLPPEYTHLIALYNTVTDAIIGNPYTLLSLYKEKLNKDIDELTKSRLIDVHFELNHDVNIFEVSSYKKMREYMHCLKQINNNPNYFEVLDKISENTNLSLKTIIKFAGKYDDTEMFSNLVNQEKDYELDTINKIEMLSKLPEIEDKESLKDINNFTLEQIKKSEKENVAEYVKISGGPFGRVGETFFKYGFDREVRTVLKEGQELLEIVNSYERHIDAVNSIYEDIEFPTIYNSALERTIYAAKKIGSATFMLEGNVAIITLPSSLEDAQSDKVLELLDSANKEGLVGLCKYDEATDKVVYPFGDENISVEETKKYIETLINKEYEIQNTK